MDPAYDFPSSIMRSLPVMIAEHYDMSNAERADSYLANIADKIGVLGYNLIPNSTDDSYPDFVRILNRYTPDKPVLGLQIVTYQAFQRWTRYDHLKELSSREFINLLNSIDSPDNYNMEID